MTTEEFKKEAKHKAMNLAESLRPLINQAQAERVMSIYYMDMVHAFEKGVEEMERIATEIIQG